MNVSDPFIYIWTPYTWIIPACKIPFYAELVNTIVSRDNREFCIFSSSGWAFDIKDSLSRLHSSTWLRNWRLSMWLINIYCWFSWWLFDIKAKIPKGERNPNSTVWVSLVDIWNCLSFGWTNHITVLSDLSHDLLIIIIYYVLLMPHRPPLNGHGISLCWSHRSWTRKPYWTFPSHSLGLSATTLLAYRD